MRARERPPFSLKRIARLVREGHARPDEILAVTYTKNAAQEMRQRVQEELRGTDLSAEDRDLPRVLQRLLLRENGSEFGVLDDQDLGSICAGVFVN